MKKLIIILSMMTISLSAFAIPMGDTRPLVNAFISLSANNQISPEFLIVTFAIPLLGLICVGIHQHRADKYKQK